MPKEPPHKLDPHVAIRDPDSLPKLLRSGMHDYILRETRGSDPDAEVFIKAFNIIAWSLLTAGTTRSNHKDEVQRTRPSKLRKVLKTGRKKKAKRTAIKAARDGSEARLKINPKDEARVVLTKIGKDVEREKLKRPQPSPSGRMPRARSRRKKARQPWVAFDLKAAAFKRWADSIYEDDKAHYDKNWWATRGSRG